MRKTQIADALFPKIRQGILAATTLNPDRWWYLSDLARKLSTSPSSLQRELDSLVEAGILLRRVEGRQVYFSPSPNCPVLPEIQSLMAKTVGLVDVLRAELAPLSDSITCAFIYGSLARGELKTQSDVDLLVLGEVRLSDLAPRLQAAGDRMGREVNPSVYTAADFTAKRRAGQHFVQSVLSQQKLFVMGGEDELQAALQTRKGSATQAHEAGTGL